VAGAGAVWEAVHGEGTGPQSGQPAGAAEEGIPQCAHRPQQPAERLGAGALACTDAPGGLLDQRGHPVKSPYPREMTEASVVIGGARHAGNGHCRL
jgi:hypothetical protein